MMKEKKTLLNNNENGTGLPSKPSIMSENKLQNTVFSAIGSASPAHKLVQGSSAAAFLKNHESLSGCEALGAVDDSMEQEGDYASAAGAERKNCLYVKKIICEPELPRFACLLPIF